MVFVRFGYTKWSSFTCIGCLTGSLAGCAGPAAPVERWAAATEAVSLTLTPVPGYRELP